NTSSALIGLDPDCPPMGTYDLPADGQAETRAAAFLPVDPDEFLEDQGLVFSGDAYAIVLDRNLDIITCLYRGEPDMPAFLDIAQGIGNQVGKDPDNLVGISNHRRQLLDIDDQEIDPLHADLPLEDI